MRMFLLLFAFVLGTQAALAAEAPLDALSAPDFLQQFPATTSVYVEQGGKIIAERYFGGAGPNTLHDTRSVSKTVTAMAAGLALKDGAISSLSVSILGLFGPDAAPSSALGQVSLRDLLTMSSALDCDDNDNSSPGREDLMHEQADWVKWGLSLPRRKVYARDKTGLGPFHYCTINAVLAGHAVGHAVKRKIEDYVKDRLFSPLGITAYEWQFSPSGQAMTGGGLRLKTQDLAKLGRLLRDKGRWQGEPLLQDAFVAEMLTPHRAQAEQEYGYFMWRHQIPSRCGTQTFWYMGGNGGNIVAIVPALNAVVVVTRTRFNTPTMWMETGRLLGQHLLSSLECSPQ